MDFLGASLTQDLRGKPRRAVLARSCYDCSRRRHDIAPEWYDIVVPGTTKQSRTVKNGQKQAAAPMKEEAVKSKQVSNQSHWRFSIAPMMDWSEKLNFSKP